MARPWLLLVALAGAALPAVEEGWSTTGRFGLFGTSVGTRGSDTSRDPTIHGTTDSTAVQGRLESELDWRHEANSVDQHLRVVYGAIHQAEVGWAENADEIRYDGVARHMLRVPQFLYLGWGLETVFNGPQPAQRPFDPAMAHASLGYGILLEDLLPQTDQLELRVGLRTLRRWGDSLAADQRHLESGPEAFARYARKVTPDLSYRMQYEGFSHFRDLGHTTHLVTAGLDVALARHLTLTVAVRGYYETHPEDDDGRPGYDELGLRQETLLGITYHW